MEEELKELEEEITVEREGTMIDKHALGEELKDIEENLPQDLKEEHTDEELREILCEIYEEREGFEAAMDLDASGFLQDEEE
ncbi:hypothetical protein [Salinarchaeum laminariae]|uniref:hypothetical protein n=1 Tax=Salinarchaeum laminariae TaxID=869888 RepID=UPI0020BDDC1C|nr:hypothetical protein [Salinarchaeum laminariae]